MRKNFLGLLALLVACAQVATAQPTTQNLMGSGMPAQLSTYLNESAPFRSNNTAIKMLDASGTPIPVLKQDASNDTVLDTGAGDVVIVSIATTPEATFGDGTLTGANNTYSIVAPTAVAQTAGGGSLTFGGSTATFSGNAGIVAAPTSVAMSAGGGSVTLGNDTVTYSASTGVLAAPTAVAIKAAGANVATVTDLGIAFASAGQGVKLPSYVPTMAATPAAGTNDFKVGLNVVPTAAADTAALLKATPVVGDVYHIYNSNSANAIRIKAGGAATINGAAAGGYIGLAALTEAVCKTTAAANHSCTLLPNPTPAGP